MQGHGSMAIQLNGSKANKNVKEYRIALNTDPYTNKLTQEHMKLKDIYYSSYDRNFTANLNVC